MLLTLILHLNPSDHNTRTFPTGTSSFSYSLQGKPGMFLQPGVSKFGSRGEIFPENIIQKKEILNFLFMQISIDILSILTLYYMIIIKAYTKCTN